METDKPFPFRKPDESQDDADDRIRKELKESSDQEADRPDEDADNKDSSGAERDR